MQCPHAKSWNNQFKGVGGVTNATVVMKSDQGCVLLAKVQGCNTEVQRVHCADGVGDKEIIVRGLIWARARAGAERGNILYAAFTFLHNFRVMC
jgi:hypothetical protein